MSANFYCWEPGLGLSPEARDFSDRLEEIHERNAEPPSAAMIAFVEALLVRYPDLSDREEDTVWAAGPLQREILGRFINVAVIWSRADEALHFVRDTAHSMGLHFYDPQAEKFYPALGFSPPKAESWFSRIFSKT